MSSFDEPHSMYLFDMKDGRKKLAYGPSPEAALEILACRLTAEEMSRIVRDRHTRIGQRELHRYIHLLG